MYIFLYIWKFHTCIQRNIIFTLLLLPSPTTTMFFKNCPSEFHDPLNNPLNLFSTFHTWVAIHWSMRNLQVATISKLIMSVPSLNNYSPSTASHQVVSTGYNLHIYWMYTCARIFSGLVICGSLSHNHDYCTLCVITHTVSSRQRFMVLFPTFQLLIFILLLLGYALTFSSESGSS